MSKDSSPGLELMLLSYTHTNRAINSQLDTCIIHLLLDMHPDTHFAQSVCAGLNSTLFILFGKKTELSRPAEQTSGGTKQPCGWSRWGWAVLPSH